jgi:hypothetical protein
METSEVLLFFFHSHIAVSVLFLYQRETTDTSEYSDLVVCQRNLAAARLGSVSLPAATSSLGGQHGVARARFRG